MSAVESMLARQLLALTEVIERDVDDLSDQDALFRAAELLSVAVRLSRELAERMDTEVVGRRSRSTLEAVELAHQCNAVLVSADVDSGDLADQGAWQRAALLARLSTRLVREIVRGLDGACASPRELAA